MPEAAQATSAGITSTGTLLQRAFSSGALVLGRNEVPVSMVLFFNHESQYSRAFFEKLYPSLYADYISTGKVRLSLVPVPFQKFVRSEEAASFLLCGAAQTKTQEMNALLLAGIPDDASMKTAGIDGAKIRACAPSADTLLQKQRQRSWIADLDIQLVPTYFVDEKKFIGLPEWPDMRGQIEEALRFH